LHASRNLSTSLFNAVGWLISDDALAPFFILIMYLYTTNYDFHLYHGDISLYHCILILLANEKNNDIYFAIFTKDLTIFSVFKFFFIIWCGGLCCPQCHTLKFISLC
jgi:hypothetical protein